MRRKIEEATIGDLEDSAAQPTVVVHAGPGTVADDAGEEAEQCGSSISPPNWEVRRGVKRKTPLTHSIDNILGGTAAERMSNNGGAMSSGVNEGGWICRGHEQ